MNRIVEFCKDCAKCPVVEFTDDAVVIGEKDNKVKLTHGQFKDLKQAILDGKL